MSELDTFERFKLRMSAVVESTKPSPHACIIFHHWHAWKPLMSGFIPTVCGVIFFEKQMRVCARCGKSDLRDVRA